MRNAECGKAEFFFRVIRVFSDWFKKLKTTKHANHTKQEHEKKKAPVSRGLLPTATCLLSNVPRSPHTSDLSFQCIRHVGGSVCCSRIVRGCGRSSRRYG